MARVPITESGAPAMDGNLPSPTDFAMAAAMMHQEGRLQLAGDVVPFPMSGTGLPIDNAARHLGPTNKSAPYAVGKETDEKVKPIPLDVLKGWMERTSARPR